MAEQMPIARLDVSTGALSSPLGSSQVRCTPVMLPARSVTAAISAGQVSVGAVGIGPIMHRGWKRSGCNSVQGRNAARRK